MALGEPADRGRSGALGTVQARRGRRLTAIAIAACVAAVVSVPSAVVARPERSTPRAAPAGPARVGQDDPGSLKDEYDEVLGEEQGLLDQLTAIQARHDELTGKLADLESSLATHQLDLLAAQASLVTAEQVAATKAAQAKKAAEQVAIVEQRLSDQVVAAYVAGGESGDLLGAILRAESSTDAENAMTYSKVVIGDTDKTLRDLERAEAAQRAAAKAAKTAKTAATTHRNEIAAATTFIATARDTQAQLVTDINVEALLQTAKLQEIQGRKALVEARITAMNHASDGVAQLLAAVQAGQPDWTPGSVLITTPIPGHRIGSKFGLRHHPILGIDRLHAGGDIGAANGTPIYAPADGLVVFAGERGGYGNTTVIDHGHSLGTLYGHQSRLNVVPGQSVTRGDLIGWVGSTGLSTGPHLHFETRLKGMPVDPEGIVDFDSPVPYGN